MNIKKMNVTLFIGILIGLLTLSFTGAAAQDSVTLIYLVDESQNSQDMANALADAYMAEHPNVTITVE
ncbi:MAG: hypothetical protein K8I30_03870, partial [Anaerolineae bacterium]|nr:hypothetical protein [Anaerolineae bacterium]